MKTTVQLHWRGAAADAHDAKTKVVRFASEKAVVISSIELRLVGGTVDGRVSIWDADIEGQVGET